MNVTRRFSPWFGLVASLSLGPSCGDPHANDTADDEVGISTHAPVSDETESTSSQEATDETESSTREATDELSTDSASEDSTTGETCGGELYSHTKVPPNMLIVEDRSGSMNEAIDGISKWEIAKAAIEQVVTTYADQVRFGLMLYPGSNESCDEGMGCGPGKVFVDVGPATSIAIIDVLAASGLCLFGTPTAETLAPLRDYPGLEDVERPNYVLLITDGQSSCDDPVPEVEDLRLEDPEIKTFVVGFGGAVDANELSDMAKAGGTALPGDPTYYQADDAQALEEAFAAIAGDVLSCSYVLDQVPPEPDKLYVYIDDELIERDETHTDGWDYDPLTNQVTFYGPACDQLKSGEVEDLQFIFGCPLVG